ncbi:MAG: hypothetical protein ACTSU2_00185 [Promethearchaeota archaeon]
MEEIDILIQQMINALVSSGKIVDLKNVSKLLDTSLEIVIMKTDKLLRANKIVGVLDKEKSLFYPKEMESEGVVLFDGADNESNEEPSVSSKAEQLEQIYMTKQKEFIKSESKERSQDDLIGLMVKLGYVGANIRLTIKITNASELPITELLIKLNFADNIEFLKTKPNYEAKIENNTLSIKLPDLKGKKAIGFYVYFKLISLGHGIISGKFQYVNYQDYVRFILIDNFEYNLKPPKIIEADIPTFEIEKYSSQKGMKKDIRSFGKPDQMKELTAFNHVQQIVESYGFKLINKVEKEDSLIAWYFGQTESLDNDVLIVGQVYNNKIEFFAASLNPLILSSLLVAFSIDLKKRLLTSGVVSSEEEIYDLYCKNCNGVLPYFPRPGEVVVCKYCGTENIVR